MRDNLLSALPCSRRMHSAYSHNIPEEIDLVAKLCSPKKFKTFNNLIWLTKLMIKAHGKLKTGIIYFFYTITILVKRKIEFQLKISSSIQQQVVLGFMLLDLSGGNPNCLLSAYKRIKKYLWNYSRCTQQ